LFREQLHVDFFVDISAQVLAQSLGGVLEFKLRTLDQTEQIDPCNAMTCAANSFRRPLEFQLNLQQQH
jgi:hypothetical protein